MSRTFKQRIVTGLISIIVKAASLGTMTIGCNEETITLSTVGTTTDTTATFLPANSIILGVSGTVLTTITASGTGWKLGDATTTGRFSANNTTLTAGTATTELVHFAGVITTTAAGPTQAAAAACRITIAGGNPGAGVIRVTCWFLKFTPATT